MFAVAPTAVGSGIGPRIVGGTEADAGEYPAQGYLALDTNGDLIIDSFCGGTLVGSTWFLTAAHCATDDFGTPFPATSFFVMLGDNDLAPPNTFIDVVGVDVNPAWNPDTFQNDLAMLRLAVPAQQQPLRVIRTDETSKWVPGTQARIVGWGRTSEGGPTSSKLREANVPIRSDSDCSSPLAYNTAFDPATMVCAAPVTGGTDTCQGDSGGPLMVPDGAGGLVLVGVTSWGIGCARADKPGIYARLGASALNQWTWARIPQAGFSAGPANSGQPTPLNQTSYHPDGAGGFTTFNWDLDNDGQYDDASGASVSPTFPSSGMYVVGLEASKPGGDRSVSRQSVGVNGTPTAEAGGPYTIREGGRGTFAGSGTDPEGQPLTFGWDLDRNGSYETPGANPAISAARTDGPVTLTVNFRACDAPGACSTDTASVRVTNVAPRVRGGRDRRARRGQRVRIRASVTDPGVGDRIRISWTCGNGRRGTGRTATCRYRRAGRFTVRFTARDDDGARGTDSVRVRVRVRR